MSVLGYAVVRSDTNSFTWWGQEFPGYSDEGEVMGTPGFTTKSAAESGLKEASSKFSDLFKLVEIREAEA